MSETPTTTTSQKSIAIHLQFALQCASNLYRNTFGAIELSGEGSTSVLLPFVSQCSSHLYRNTPPICIAILSLRAKGTLISEPRFSTPCEMRFFPRDRGKMAFFKEEPSKKAIFPISRAKNRISQGVENRGSLISVPLALRVWENLGGCGHRDVPQVAVLKGRMHRVMARKSFGKSCGLPQRSDRTPQSAAEPSRRPPQTPLRLRSQGSPYRRQNRRIGKKCRFGGSLLEPFKWAFWGI